MLWVVLIIGLALDVGVVEKSNSADLVAYDYYGFPQNLSDLRDVVVGAELMPDTLQLGVGPQTFAKPLQLEVNGVRLDWSVSFYLVKGHFVDTVFAEHVEVVCGVGSVGLRHRGSQYTKRTECLPVAISA